ncbi:MAG: putative DNA binding domain-containing protein [Salinivirgaceae bacterium]|jgi:ATP-dependent DNA helicase RecG|nr:putative DNA binding domain-containing protein [Salinivirgaceae bacterium]
MALPINIEELIHGRTVEWERLEFKQGWNPEDVMHTMCAFANDLHNWGGGYIIVGIEENNGQPVLPPEGIGQDQLDRIQGEIIGLANKIQPNYFPIVQPCDFQEKHILVLWCPAGDNRPYTAITTLGNGGQRQPYVRIGSRSIIARGENLRKLQELTARIPFDDRVNNQATIQDFDLSLIQAHLHEVKSSLYEESKTMSFENLCRAMLIAKGANEDIRPVNVGLLFFCKQPERFFQRAWIELVWHKDNSGQNFTETYFKGPVQKHLRDALSFIKTNIIQETVIKHKDKAESDRFYNYPYDAIEEALSNAVYHKSYELGSPIEVQIFPDKITILSHPGPVAPVDAVVLSTQRQIIARVYRNRRIGDFLKELHLTEGRGTGFPTIYDAMANNGSPKPVFETDETTYVLVTLPIRKGTDSNGASNGVKYLTFITLDEVMAFSNGASNGAGNGAKDAIAIIEEAIHERVFEILEILVNKQKRAELFAAMHLSNQTKNREKYLDPLIKIGWVKKEYESDTHPDQKYMTTESGKRILNLIKS